MYDNDFSHNYDDGHDDVQDDDDDDGDDGGGKKVMIMTIDEDYNRNF